MNYQQVVDQLQGMQSKLDEAKELADVATIDVERYKRLAVQQEKSITALQARLEGTEARARDGAVNADLVDQLRTERDQMAALLKKVRPAQLLLTQSPSAPRLCPAGMMIIMIVTLSWSRCRRGSDVAPTCLADLCGLARC